MRRSGEQAEDGARSGGRRYDLLLGAAAVLVVLMVVVRPWAPLLDLLLAINVLGATIVLVLALTARDPLELPAFPSLLLLGGLLRIALVIATARLILAQATGGALVETLGRLAAGDSWGTGLGLFAVLAIVQVVVVSAGGGRAAEVAARFYLDALPGKQMGIDADLSSRAIDARTAEARRSAVEAEADFYGAMDGASKFVRGEAIAIIVIIAVTFLGGAATAVSRGASWQEALARYSLLAGGESVVILVPALMMSAGAALMLTKIAGGAAADEMMASAGLRSGPLWIAASLLLLLALVPGAPRLALAIVGGLGMLWAWTASRGRPEPVSTRAQAAPSAATEPRVGEITVRLGMALVGLAAEGEGLLGRLTQAKEGVSRRLGIGIPSVVVTDDEGLVASEFVVEIRGQQVASGRLRPAKVLLSAPRGYELPAGPRGPAEAGRHSVWLAPEEAGKAAGRGCRLLTAADALVMAFREALCRHAPSLFDRQAAKDMLAAVRRSRPAVVEELERLEVSLGTIRGAFSTLLAEGLAVTDPIGILERIADAAEESREPRHLAEAARRALVPTITRQVAEPTGEARPWMLGALVEEALAEAEAQNAAPAAVLPAESVAELMEQLELAAAGQEAGQVVLMCSPQARRGVWELLRDALPWLVVVAGDEIDPAVPIVPRGTVDVERPPLTKEGAGERVTSPEPISG